MCYIPQEFRSIIIYNIIIKFLFPCIGSVIYVTVTCYIRNFSCLCTHQNARKWRVSPPLHGDGENLFIFCLLARVFLLYLLHNSDFFVPLYPET